jgi:para-nitrobenzyl esterase
MSARWLAFAKGESPDALGLPDAPIWPRFDEFERRTLVISSVDRVVPDLDGELRRGWGDEVIAFP